MSDPVLDDWKRGDKFSASHLQQPVDICKTLVHYTTSRGGTFRTRHGTATIMELEDRISEWAWGQIHIPTSGDYTDERYFVKFAYIYNTPHQTDPVSWKAVDNLNGAYGNYTTYPLTATNLAEMYEGTHGLKDTTIVRMFKVYDRQKPRVPHWFFVQGGGAESSGQYQYQVHQMTAQNVSGWDFIRAHPLI